MTPQQIDAMKLALEALEGFYEYGYDRQECFEHITALEEALAEHAMRETQRLGQEIEQEPCVHAKNPKGCYRVRCQLGDKCVDDEMSFRTTPPQRTQPNDIDLFWSAVTTPEKWVGLTVDEILSALESVDPETKRLPKGFADFAYAVEAKLKEKNCG